MVRFLFFKEEFTIANFNYASNYGKDRRPNKNTDLVNELIRFPEVLVIGPNGESFGKMTRYEALKKAEEYELDLLCVSPNTTPPVCKILNYGKQRFENQKKTKEAKKNQKIIEVKEIQLTPQIGQHDLDTKVKAGIKFLSEGNKIKVALRYRGRQMAHLEVGEEVMKRFIAAIEEFGVVEKAPFMEGRLLTAFIAGKGKK
ncbi:MAG TPA: translation initiation factor IF-3 [Candidatus Onthovivens sp.]|nr:translation initiation factor IF-3 [Candidatus Onthovivens sp.]